MHAFNGGLAANPAAAAAEHVTRERLESRRIRPGEQDFDHIAVGRPGHRGTAIDFEKIGPRGDHALSQKKACRQFFIVSRRAHEHGDGSSFDPQFERFLYRNHVACRRGRSVRLTANQIDGRGRVRATIFARRPGSDGGYGVPPEYVRVALRSAGAEPVGSTECAR